MPFKSEAQHRKFRAMVAEGNMEQSTLDKMMKETKKANPKSKHPIKALPERVRVEKTAGLVFSIGFMKVAGGPGSGVSHPNTLPIEFLETSPLMSIGHRQEFMDNNTPVEKDVKISYKDIKYKGQEKMVPKKVVRILVHADDALKKPIDVIRDDKGDLHILDGHHRGIVAILLKRNLRANIYTMDNVIKKIAMAEMFVPEEARKGLEKAKNGKERKLKEQRNFAFGQHQVTGHSKIRDELTADSSYVQI